MLTQRISLTNQDARTVSATKLHELGTIAETADGRAYRYALAGAVNLNPGLLNNTVARVANHINASVAAAAAVNSRTVSVTVGATAVTAGQYDDGFLVVNDAPGVGSAYKIAGTPAISSSGTGVVQLDEGIATALTTASKVSFAPNPYAGSIVTASSVSLFCNGSNNVAVPATNYYWSQTCGIASVLSDGVIAKGAGAIISDAVAGAAETEAATTVTQRIGTAVEPTVDTKYYPIFLSLNQQ